jgi:[acyl-carrier-protein] S-malonyltransferase
LIFALNTVSKNNDSNLHSNLSPLPNSNSTLKRQIFAVFPGQGSQKPGMGYELYKKYDSVKNLFQLADDILGFKISKLCFEGPLEELTFSDKAQPAILLVSTASYNLYKLLNSERIEKNSPHFITAAAAGHSLGEFSALVAAGALRFEDAIMLVHKRGQFMQECIPLYKGEKDKGKMIAVLGKEVADIEAIIRDMSLPNTDAVVEIANINAPGQIVVSGNTVGMKKFISMIEGLKFVELNVSAPFHSTLMKEASDKFAEEIDNIELKKPEFPIFANVSGTPLTDPDVIREALKAQVCSRVRWVECVQNYFQQYDKNNVIVEFGYGSILSGLAKRICKDMSFHIGEDSSEKKLERKVAIEILQCDDPERLFNNLSL